MKIVIAHLYYDLLNLYGECGNVKILKKVLEEKGFNVIVKLLTVDDELHFDKYDFVYIGMGIKENLEIVNNHLLKYREDIKKYIISNKYLLSTGNSYELFGNKIFLENKCIKTLGIFGFESKLVENRIVREVSAKCDLYADDIIGFMNVATTNDYKGKSFLKNINNSDENEGVFYNNFIGTYLIGPILVRNPKLLKKIITNIIKTKTNSNKVGKIDLKLLELAYLDCLERRKNNKEY